MSAVTMGLVECLRGQPILLSRTTRIVLRAGEDNCRTCRIARPASLHRSGHGANASGKRHFVRKALLVPVFPDPSQPSLQTDGPIPQLHASCAETQQAKPTSPQCFTCTEHLTVLSIECVRDVLLAPGCHSKIIRNRKGALQFNSCICRVKRRNGERTYRQPGKELRNSRESQTNDGAKRVVEHVDT